jgi:DNA-binding NarL/FixJ family response regulator/class 3 adenylate cyclase
VERRVSPALNRSRLAPVATLPTGVVTFLFTDVEDSTGLLQRLGDDYRTAMADHRRLVRGAVEEMGGLEVDARADEFCVVFTQPRDAVEAAIRSQRAHAQHSWPGNLPVKVRMGLHTGEPALEEGDYVGLDLHRAARICSVGHGGQVLLSEATRNLVADGLEADLKELGEHPLKGIQAPERIFQVVLADLPSAFPPLRFADPQAQPVGGQSAGEERLKVVLADDAVLLREGIARLLAEAGLEVVGQAGTADELLLKVRSYSPDVAVVDIRMPPTQTDEGLRAAQEIRATYPDVGVLVLSQYVEPAYAMELLAESAEGVGYLLKDRVADVEEFAAAVRRVAQGGSALDPALVTQLVGRRREHDPLDDLTPREREVLELMAEGRSNQAIGERLFVTPRAVEKHITSIFGKLRLPQAPEDHRRVLAVLAYLRA